MKKVILSIIILIFLTGCGGLYDINNFILPDDLEFLTLIEELDTPKKICQYMLDNFEFEEYPYKTLTPYQLYKSKVGDCNDFSLFAVFIANCHGYETYQIFLKYASYVYGYPAGHIIAIFKEENCYNICEVLYYQEECWKTFKDIAENFIGWTFYKVYDYNMTIVEQGYNN